jgi:hypothetical protein
MAAAACSRAGRWAWRIDRSLLRFDNLDLDRAGRASPPVGRMNRVAYFFWSATRSKEYVHAVFPVAAPDR